MNTDLGIHIRWIVTLSNEHESSSWSIHGHRLDNPDRARFLALRNPGYDVRIENASDPNDYYTHDAIYLTLIK